MKQYLKISPLDKKNHAVHHKPTQIKHGLWRTPGLELITRIAKPAKLVDFTFVEEQVVYSQSFSDFHREENTRIEWKSFTRPFQAHKWTKTEDFPMTTIVLLSDTQMNIMASRISDNFQHLQKLELIFRQCSALTGKGLEALGSHIGRHLLKLKCLSLEFEQCSSIPNKGFRIFALELSQYLDLNELNVKFQRCERLTDSTFDFSLHVLLLHFVNLQKLSLNFEGSMNITDKGLAKFFIYAGRYLKKLQKLNLCFWRCEKIGDNSLQSLALALEGEGNLSHLKELIIDFHRCVELSDKGLSDLLAFITKQAPNLKHLILDLGACNNITDNGLEMLGTEIKEHLKELKDLKLSFKFCKNVTEKGVANLQTMLKFIPAMIRA